MAVKVNRAQRVADMTAELVRVYGEYSSNPETAALMNIPDWYDTVRAQLQGLVTQYGFPLAAVSGATAALSVEQDWARNLAGVQYCLIAMTQGAQSGADFPAIANKYGSARQKAFDILKGMDSQTVLGNYGKPTKAYKTRDFDASIMGNHFRPVIDRHQVRICLGMTIKEKAPKADGPLYEDCALATTNAARILGLTPRTLQWKLWVAFRGAAF